MDFCIEKLNNLRLQSENLLNVFKPEGVENIVEYFISVGDSCYLRGDYSGALLNYNLIINSINSESEVNIKVENSKKLNLVKTKTTALIISLNFSDAIISINEVLKVNPEDIEMHQYKSICQMMINDLVVFGDTLAISKYEITNQQYAGFLNLYKKDYVIDGENSNEKLIYEHPWGVKNINNKWYANEGYENHPVINVTWYGAKEFANFFNVELPPLKIFRNNFLGYQKISRVIESSWNKQNSDGTTHNVGELDASYELHDIYGNVWEWINTENLITGGSWSTVLKGEYTFEFNYYIRVTETNQYNNQIGFRICKTIKK
jgi:Sulfatase-modifying factor enzyme 1